MGRAGAKALFNLDKGIVLTGSINTCQFSHTRQGMVAVYTQAMCKILLILLKIARIMIAIEIIVAMVIMVVITKTIVVIQLLIVRATLATIIPRDKVAWILKY